MDFFIMKRFLAVNTRPYDSSIALKLLSQKTCDSTIPELRECVIHAILHIFYFLFSIYIHFVFLEKTPYHLTRCVIV